MDVVVHRLPWKFQQCPTDRTGPLYMVRIKVLQYTRCQCRRGYSSTEAVLNFPKLGLSHHGPARGNPRAVSPENESRSQGRYLPPTSPHVRERNCSYHITCFRRGRRGGRGEMTEVTITTKCGCHFQDVSHKLLFEI